MLQGQVDFSVYVKCPKNVGRNNVFFNVILSYMRKINEEIVEDMVKLGCDRSEVVDSLRKGVHNQV